MLTIASKENCLRCTTVKNRLDSTNVAYRELMIGRDISIEDITKVIGRRPTEAPVIWNDDDKEISTFEVLNHNIKEF